MNSEKEILDLKAKLELANIDYRNLVFMPAVPMVGIHEFSIEEIAGLRIARLISASNE